MKPSNFDPRLRFLNLTQTTKWRMREKLLDSGELSFKYTVAGSKFEAGFTRRANKVEGFATHLHKAFKTQVSMSVEATQPFSGNAYTIVLFSFVDGSATFSI